MADAFTEIMSKFDRAREHIDALKVEVDRLLENIPSRPYNDSDPAARAAFESELRQMVVPVRLRIIAGEAIHQIRSSLDHLVAKLVAKTGNMTTDRTEFPILPHRPMKPKDVRRFEKKALGVADAPKGLIESLQPYQRTTPFEQEDSYLNILKNMNNRDKHHEPVLSVVACKPTLRYHGRLGADELHSGRSERGRTSRRRSHCKRAAITHASRRLSGVRHGAESAGG